MLFRSIRGELEALNAVARSAEVMENELQGFLESYYSRVLPLTARLERLRYRKEYGVFPKQPLVQDIAPAQGLRGLNPLARRKKALFRSLAKRCHPDNQQSAPVDIAEVFAAKTLSALWLLEIRAVCDGLDNAEINRYLETQRRQVHAALREGLLYKESIVQGQWWQLKESVFDAALQGSDLIEQIQCRIEKQIAALQQYFVKPRGLLSAA